MPKVHEKLAESIDWSKVDFIGGGPLVVTYKNIVIWPKYVRSSDEPHAHLYPQNDEGDMSQFREIVRRVAMKDINIFPTNVAQTILDIERSRQSNPRAEYDLYPALREVVNEVFENVNDYLKNQEK